MSTTGNDAQLIWGVNRIAAIIGRKPAATRRLLALGAVPGARRISGRYALDPEALKKAFLEQRAGATR